MNFDPDERARQSECRQLHLLGHPGRDAGLWRQSPGAVASDAGLHLLPELITAAAVRAPP